MQNRVAIKASGTRQEAYEEDFGGKLAREKNFPFDRFQIALPSTASSEVSVSHLAAWAGQGLHLRKVEVEPTQDPVHDGDAAARGGACTSASPDSVDRVAHLGRLASRHRLLQCGDDYWKLRNSRRLNENHKIIINKRRLDGIRSHVASTSERPAGDFTWNVERHLGG